MDLNKAEMILSEAIACYISNNPEKKGDIIAAINTIGSSHREAANLIEQHGQLMERTGKIMRIQNALMCASLRAYP